MVNFIKKYFKKEKSLADKEPETRTILLQNYPLGSSGTQIFSGYINEDHLAEMTGVQRAEFYDKMEKDYNITMCLNAVINPIKSATWEIQAGDDTPEAEEDAALIRHILFEDMDKPFDTFLSEALTFISKGYALFEIVHKVVTNHPDFKNYIGIECLGWRSQKTIYSWKIDEREKLISVLQQAYGDNGKTVEMNADFLLLFNTGALGANFEGVSWLRGPVGPYKRKNNYLRWLAAGIERFSIPTPTAEVPAGKEESPELDILVRVLQAYTSHQNNYLTYPAGWNVKLNANTGFDPSKIEVSVDNEDKRITKAFLANFLELGMNGTGAYSLSNDLSDFFLSGLQQVGNEICKKMNQKTIKDLVILNKGPRKTYPKLVVSNISDKAGKELAEIVKTFTDANVIIPDDRLEDHMRTRYNLPARSEEGQRTKQIAPALGFSMSERIAKALRGKKCQKRQ